MRSVIPVVTAARAYTRRRKKSPRATVDAVYEPNPVIVEDGTWRVGWHPVGPNGEVRFVAIDEDGHWVRLPTPRPSAKG